MIMANSITLGTLPQLTKVPYDPFRDLAAVSKVSAAPFVLVANASVPFNNVTELIAHARANPGKLNLATPGIGSTQHLVLALLDRKWGTTITHIPYKGGSQTTADLVSGQVQLMLDFPVIVAPHIKAGRLKGLGVAGERRSVAIPDVPTFEELGHSGLQITAWQGIQVPAGTPREIVARLSEAIVKVLNQPDIREAFISGGADVGGSSPEHFASFIRAEHARWGALIREAGLRLE
jgi:tripartite-type tricarboxylate transporter receptor subunit TctC